MFKMVLRFWFSPNKFITYMLYSRMNFILFFSTQFGFRIDDYLTAFSAIQIRGNLANQSANRSASISKPFSVTFAFYCKIDCMKTESRRICWKLNLRYGISISWYCSLGLPSDKIFLIGCLILICWFWPLCKKLPKAGFGAF